MADRTDYFGPAEQIAEGINWFTQEDAGDSARAVQLGQLYATLALVQAVEALTGVLEDRLRP
ncbi:MAG: hypothetical protein GEU78_09545 [Actinobacteria bacterium]|nr:hypothetical protein [Actinomycetota bacterium]